MSVLVSREVWKHSRASGNDLAVLLCLADAVNDQRAKRGEPWHAWLSQSTIATRCNCSLATVKRSYGHLQERGEIAIVGTKAGARGVKVVDVLPLGSAQDDLAQDDPAQIEPGGETEGDDLAHANDDLAQSGDDLAHFASPPSSTVSYKPEEPEISEPEDAEPDARAGARDSGLSPSSPGVQGPTPAQLEAERREAEADLTEVEALLARRPDDKLLNDRRAELRAELAIHAEEAA